jgi:two-component system cell cycle response regulator
MRTGALSRRASLALLALTAVFAVLAVEYTFHLSASMRHVLEVGVYNNLMLAAGLVCVARGIARKHERVAWTLVGAAVLAWGTGNTVWTFTVANLPDPPFPSYADIGFLAVYPPIYVAIILLLRSRVDHVRPSLWLDGLIAGLAVGAVGTALVFPAVLGTLGGSRAAVATNLAYPLADLTLIGLVIWALAVTGWRPGRTWGFLAAGLLVFSISDALYLYETAVASYGNGSVTDLGWVAGGLLLAWAAWQPAAKRVSSAIEGWPLLVTPVCFALAALAVLIYDHFNQVPVVSLVLAGLSILAVLARLALTFGENLSMLVRTREQAHTDSLTGLGNHRGLVRDLEHALEADGTRTLLALFDLNGFKQYNDTFGHPVGDELLARIGARLAHFIEGLGTAYRMGGDEFCILLEHRGEPSEFFVTGAERALRHRGDGFSISAACGTVILPDEASTVTEALRVADERMYAQKQRGRPAAAAG